MSKIKKIPVPVEEDLVKNSTEKIDYGKLAHDLKGPLNSIKGLLFIALREIDSADAQQYLNLIEHYQQLLYYKINDLLNRLQYPEKHLTLDFLKESQIFESIRQPLSNLIVSKKTGLPPAGHRIPFSDKSDRLDSLNRILDGLQKTWSENNQDDPSKIDLKILTRDIKGSLNSIQVLLEIALSETEDKAAQNYYGLIEKTRKNLLIRVDKTLRRMHGNNSAIISNIEFDELISNVKSCLEYMDGYSDIRFEIKVTTQQPFFSDAEAIHSILQNLIENSIKYRKKDSSRHYVKLSVVQVTDGVIIKISDNGIGIKKALYTSIFEFGVRDENTHEEGHGIGLTLVKQLVEQLGGRISMHSANDQGTTFTLFIPNGK